ncbi:MAG: hypothetical protein AAGE65_06660 [Planctomycetota bacterium]
MPTSYLPFREAELLTWTETFGSLIAATPGDYGLTEGQAQAYAMARQAFAEAYQTANEPLTRSPGNVEIKNTKKDALIEETRKLVRICQAAPGMNDDKRRALGITVPDTSRTPVPPPEVAPAMDVVSVEGRTVHLRLREASTGKRRKPDGVYSATIMKYVGGSIPTELDDWVLVGSDTRLDTSVEFPDSLTPGTKVWFTAFWLNRRAESGPMCVPVSTHLGFDVAVSGGSGGEDAPDAEDDLKIAA